MPPPRTLDPLSAGEAIKDAFLQYLETTHEPRNPALRAEFKAALTDRFRLSRGPFLQAAARCRSMTLLPTGFSAMSLIAYPVMSSPLIDRCTPTKTGQSERWQRDEI